MRFRSICGVLCADSGDGWHVVSVESEDNGLVVTIGSEEWAVFEERRDAEDAAREYWADMAANDPEEFTCIVGIDTLVSWALGQAAGPGYTKTTSLDEWLDVCADACEEHHASYDGEEWAVAATPKALELLGWTAGEPHPVAYRRY